MAILNAARKKTDALRMRVLPYLLTVVVALITGDATAEGTSLQLYEQKIKAGIVYNLLKYTIWPKEAFPNKNGKLQICLYGDDPFDGYLSPLEGRTAQQIPISITQLGNIKETEHCNVVIIHRNQAQALAELLPYLDNKNILTVSDIEHFAQQGGMVELAKDGEKISLHINTNVINNTRLSIQGPMLKLAKIVSG